MRRYWLLKTEPAVFSIADLARSPDQRTFWDGVRNYQARNFLRDQIQVGDGVLLYHSNDQPTAVVGTARVTASGTPDPSQFDHQSKYFDEHAKEHEPRWYGVEIELETTFSSPVTLAAIKDDSALEGLELRRRGSRLSVQPVSAEHYRHIVRCGTRK